MTNGYTQRIAELEAEVAALRARLKPVEEVWERYKHIDRTLSIYGRGYVRNDLWQAIKEAVGK